MKEEEWQEVLLTPFGTSRRLKKIRKEFIKKVMQGGLTEKEAEQKWNEEFKKKYDEAVEEKLKKAREMQVKRKESFFKKLRKRIKK